MQQDNYIKNKLQQLDNQQLPDLSHMDKHWQQMAVTLQPATGGTSLVKSITLSVCATAVVISVFLFIDHKKTPADKKSNAGLTNKNTSAVAATKDTVFVPAKTVVNIIPPVDISGWPDNTHSTATTDHRIANAGEDDPFSIVSPPVPNDSIGEVLVQRQKDRLQLSNLFAQLEKEPTSFVIDNSKDTVVKAPDGTTIFVAANSFAANGKVVFEIKEFYNYADMIANRLTTMSGSEQLITGGMIHLSASVDGKEVLINPGKEIRVFIPGITTYDSMKIFKGIVAGNIDVENEHGLNNKKIDWELTKIRIDSPVLKRFIRAIDLKDDSVELSSFFVGTGTKAVFLRSLSSVYSKNELQKILREKYGDVYDKIRVRKQWKKTLLFKNKDWRYVGVGDTTEVSPLEVKIYKLAPIDTVYRICRWVPGRQFRQINELSGVSLKSVGEKYSIGLTSLGWINCDKFNDDKRAKTDFFVDLGEGAETSITYMVFERYKSIMQGYLKDGKVVFPLVPINEPVKIISVAVKHGEVVSAMKTITTSENMLTGLQFEGTDAAGLKASLSKNDH